MKENNPLMHEAMQRFAALENALLNRRKQLSVLTQKQKSFFFKTFASKAAKLNTIDEIFRLKTDIEAKELYLKTLNKVEQ